MASIINAATSGGLITTADTSGVLNLQTAGTTAITVDAAQNVGIGVTPNSWDSLYKAIQVGARSMFFGIGSEANMANNAYYNSGYKYVANSAAGLYTIDANVHKWYNAPSGTAGNAITFTQAMTFDASGNLGIGTASPSAEGKLTVGSTTVTDKNGILLNRGAAATPSGTQGAIFYEWNSFGGTAESLSFRTHGGYKFQNGSGATTFATIDTSGNLGIGISSPTAVIDVLGSFFNGGQSRTNAGTKTFGFRVPHCFTATNPMNVIAGLSTTSVNYVYIGGSDSNIGGTAATDLLFYTAANNTTANGTERMRINSNGRVYIGTGAADYPFSVRLASDSGNFLTKFENTNAGTPYGMYMHYSAVAPNNSVNEFLYCGDTVGQKMSIRSNGGIANYSASNSNLSDRREKTNFAPAKSYLDVICAIPVQTFNYIDQNMEDDPGLTLGVVAQDVQAVAPELVMESNWGTEEDPKMRLSIYQTDLQYALMKSIQEQQALITQLIARITALEGGNP